MDCCQWKLYTEGGEYVGNGPSKKKILSKEELDHQHLLHRLTSHHRS